MSNTIQDIADHLRAANFEHVRAVIEPDDNMVLIDYLESQGFISAEARARDEADAATQAELEAEDNSATLDSMTKAELLAEADKRGIGTDSGMTKADIIAAIESESK